MPPSRLQRRVWFLVIAMSVILFAIPIVRGWAIRSLLFISRPVIIIGQNLSDGLRLSQNSRQLGSERDALQKQADNLTARLFEANQLLETYRVIDALEKFTTTSKRVLLRANVIAASSDPGIQSIVIDRGSNDGLRIGQIIVTEGGYVVGKIVTLHQVTSTVLLLTDRQSKISARLQNEKQSAGIVQGERGLTLLMDFIPKNDQISIAQTVVTSGNEEGIPPDLLIGTISSISSKPSELFQQAIIVPATAFQRLRIVAAIVS